MNTQVNEMFQKDLILFDYDKNSAKDFLSDISDYLYEKGYVKKTFKEAILERESMYPTGLPTQGVSVAIPHTNIEHALKPCIVVNKPKVPVVFKQMADGIKDVYAKLIFVVVVTDPKKEVKVLQHLMDYFLNEEKLMKIYEQNNAEDMYNTLMNMMQ